MDLTGKVAFITGSAGGLGKAYAEKLLQKDAKVYLCDVNQEAGSKTLLEFQEKFGKNRCAFSVLDVTNETQFDEVFQDAINTFGNIDIMVNNAGIVNEIKWSQTIQINLTGVVRGTKKAFEHMRKDKGGRGGRIINVSSKAGLDDFYILPVYTATKHGVRAFTTSVAQQPNLPSQGIECAAICPDSTDTGKTLEQFLTEIDCYQDHIMHIFRNELMTADYVADAFVNFVEKENINGAILYIHNKGVSFQKMEPVDLGPTWNPPTPNQ